MNEPRRAFAAEALGLDLPVLLLIGGATGTGKSTVAAEVAYRLGITRITSTDFIRQTMRAFLSHEFMPSIHYSSFEAGDAYPTAESPLEFGFLEQSRHVLVGLRASMDRAVEESWSMVLEGVHIVPGMVEPRPAEAVVVECLLSISDRDVHERNFTARDAQSERPLTRYLERFAEIRQLHDLLVGRAVRAGVPVVENDDPDEAASLVADLVLDAAERAREGP